MVGKGKVARPDYFGRGSVEHLTRCWTRGEDFRSLLSDTRDFLSVVDIPDEVFTPMVLGDLFYMAPRPPWLRDILRSLPELVGAGELIHFFRDKSRLPADSDCTALVYSLAARAGAASSSVVAEVAQRVAGNTDPEGIIQVYFDPGGRREGLIDRVVCINALYLLNQAGLPDAASCTEQLVRRDLEDDAFVEGSRYYPSAETFLYFLARLVSAFPSRYARWLPALRAKIRKRQGLESRPLELAQRALAAIRLGLDPSWDVWLLRRSRLADATFPADALFRYGRSRGYFGGATLSTAFAARALVEFGRTLRFAGSVKQLSRPVTHGPSRQLRGVA